MNLALLAIGILLAGVIVWLTLQIAQGQKKNITLETHLSELRRDLLSMAQTQAQSSGQIQSIGQSVSQRLESVSKALQDGVIHSAQIATHGQTAIANELKHTREQIGELQKQLGEVQEQSRGLSLATQSLEGILGGTKTRGLLGEVTLQRLLEDSLPPSQFCMQYRFSTGECVDAVIFLRDEKMMAIDSKFPLDAFRRISSDGDEARRSFATAIKGHADAIARKYIVPNENTLDLALMFVPSENVYGEMLQSVDSKGQPIDAYCRSKKIVAVSPNTLYAHLCVIAMGLRGMQIEENAKRLLNSISGMQKQMETFADVFAKLGNHLKNAQQTYSESDKRFERAQSILGNMLSVASPGPALVPEEPALPLTQEAVLPAVTDAPPPKERPAQGRLALPATQNPK